MSDKIFLFTKILLIVLLCASPSYAGSSLAWDPPDTGTVNGYRIYYGLASGSYPDKVDAGYVTQYELSGLSLKDNTEYFFVVRAYNDAGESGDSNEISWKSGDSTPPVPPQGLNLEKTQEGPRLSWTANTESDLNSYNVCYSTTSREYGSFIPAGKVTGFTVPLSYLDVGKTYYFAIKAIDTAGNESAPSAEVNTTVSLPDTSAPQISIASPTARSATYTTNESSVSLSGTASDDTKVTKVTWTNSTGGSGTATGTANWTISDIALTEGANEIAVTAEDAAGNTGSKIITITYLIPDIIKPTISIRSPKSRGRSIKKTKKQYIDISGIASDNKGVVQVSWKNSLGNKGVASGTDEWTVSDLELVKGRNTITINASDAAGNQAEQSFTIIYLP